MPLGNKKIDFFPSSLFQLTEFLGGVMLYLVQIFSVSFSVLTASLQSAWGSISSLAPDVSLIKRLAYLEVALCTYS